jgi:WD40 repeat protein/class 3 adenylate cyclase/tRNA A-37 threonylcarbamoyl transferase component Bud32
MDPELQLTPDQRQAVEEFRQRHRTALLALLFTDVEDSTTLRGQMGELPASALMERHNREIRGALTEFPDGQEISTAGDSFFLVFAKPSDAVRFALLVQIRLRELATQVRPDLRVRMGIHLGEVIVNEDTGAGPVRDVLGMQVDLAARITALASGGQILTTRGVFDNARQMLKGQLLSGVGALAWISHGPYLLKGFEEAQEICEVGETGVAPLRQPTDCEAGKRVSVPGIEPVLGWRPAVEQAVPGTQWILEEKLGEGGFGEVWLARHRRTKEPRVFKFCFRADRLRSLKREMTLFRIMKEVLGERLDVARLHNVQFEESPYYLEIDYTPGGNLADWIKQRGGFEKVTLRLRLEIVAQIATALAAAHSVGVVHKDVKPSNILIEERRDGSIQVRLTDFGIGQLLDGQALERAGITSTGFTETASAMTELSSRTGTRLYMAPELIAGRQPSIQSDIYSLGVLLYQLIVGDLSQPMTTDWERNVRDPLLRNDLCRCLAGDPTDRFASASDLATSLRTLSQRRTRRRITRLAKVAAAALVVVAVLAGVATLVQSYRARQAEQVAFMERNLRAQAEAQKNRAERQMYYASIGLAEKCIEELRYDRAHQLLAACPRQYRNWEWGRLQFLCNLDLITYKGHSAAVRAVAFSPNGKRIATGSDDCTARLWDVETGGELVRFTGHNAAVRSVSFSPDGKRIVTASYDNTAKLWDAETGRELLTLKGHNAHVESVAFSPDGKTLATGSDDDTAKLWDAATGRELVTLVGHTDSVRSVAFSPDGRRIATTSWDHTAKLWDVETGRELLTTKGSAVDSIAFSPDGKQIATGSYDNTAKLWDAETGRELLTLKGHARFVLSVAFSPDRQRVATGSVDRTIRIWDVGTGRQLLTLAGHTDALSSIAFSPDGKYIVSGSDDGTARLWDAETHRGLASLKGHPYQVLPIRSNLDSIPIATRGADRIVKLWDLETGQKLFALKGHTGPVFWLSSSPSGKYLATAGGDKTARLWDVETGRELLTLEGHTAEVFSVTFSPDSKRIATASRDNTAKVWDAQTGQELVTLKGHGGHVAWVSFSPDGRRVATASYDNTVKLWDPETGQESLTLKGHTLWVFCVAFSPDGKMIATASDDDTAKLWYAETGRELFTLVGHTDNTRCVAFSPDGKRLATASWDKSVKLWDVETGQELLTIAHPNGPVYTVSFSPDGRRLATASGDGTAILWTALPWRDEDLPGDASMSHDERIQLYKLEQWKKRQKAREQLGDRTPTGTSGHTTP